MTMLHQVPSSIIPPARLPPPTTSSHSTSTPELVLKHLPCTFHSSVIPLELALKLFCVMLGLSKDWKRNKWWLFDCIVERSVSSSIRTTVTIIGTGMTLPSAGTIDDQRNRQWTPLPPYTIIERVVNEELKKRKRFPLDCVLPVEFTDSDCLVWDANVAASSDYKGGKESIGSHSDQAYIPWAVFDHYIPQPWHIRKSGNFLRLH